MLLVAHFHSELLKAFSYFSLANAKVTPIKEMDGHRKVYVERRKKTQKRNQVEYDYGSVNLCTRI